MGIGWIVGGKGELFHPEFLYSSVPVLQYVQVPVSVYFDACRGHKLIRLGARAAPFAYEGPVGRKLLNSVVLAVR
ncbi:MAG: hypothetical protein RBU21_16530, partial [FCB group bacterium]|nr:hypothetical protein [FCB group bacterium]